jgi:hypothetical protein
LAVDYLYLWLAGAVVALMVSTGLVFRNWKSFSLPLRLLPLDVLTVVLLIDLNLKSNSIITVDDPVMKLEAGAFTVLLAFVLFAPVIWKIFLDKKKEGSH